MVLGHTRSLSHDIPGALYRCRLCHKAQPFKSRAKNRCVTSAKKSVEDIPTWKQQLAEVDVPGRTGPRQRRRPNKGPAQDADDPTAAQQQQRGAASTGRRQAKQDVAILEGDETDSEGGDTVVSLDEFFGEGADGADGDDFESFEVSEDGEMMEGVDGDADDEDFESLEAFEGGGVKVEELFSLDRGWSVDVLGDDTSEPSCDPDDPDSEDEAEDLGMAARSVLQSIPRHRLKALESMQADADEANAATKANARRRHVAEHKTHRRLRIIGGAFAGKRLLSGRGENTRPMMEKVRKAVFDMLMAMGGGTPAFLEGTRWLDLFAGTGSVGLEALSRGAAHCQFIELDPWVSSSVLGPNLDECGAAERAVITGGKAEAFLKRAKDGAATFSGRSFDYISVCPPYLLVSYEEIFELLMGSPLLHAGSYVIVEYPQSLRKVIPEVLGPLRLLRDRKYGRTLLAVFGPPKE